MKCINVLALVLIVVGAINWGLFGFFQFDLVAWLCGGQFSMMSRIVYSIIGLAGLWSLSFFTRCHALCGCCSKCGCSKCMCSKDHNHNHKDGGCCR